MQHSRVCITGQTSRLIAGDCPLPIARYAVFILAGLFLGACSEQSQGPDLQAASNHDMPAAETNAVPAEAAAMEKGVFFKPEMKDFALHNEYDDDGDGDGVNETHVQRYINSQGDTLFSMTTNGTLWAWSLDVQGGDDSVVQKNFVIRDSNCDGVFDERYRLDAEFHVPVCLKSGNEVAADKPI